MNLKAGYPYWLIKDGLLYNYPRLKNDLNIDVVIMGGGISGALVAHSLVEAGIECVVVDARTIGLGSTCASTSLLQYEIDVPLSKLAKKIGNKNAVKAYQFCGDSIHKLAAIAEKISFKDFQYSSSLYYASDKKDLSFLSEEFEIRKANGFDVNFLQVDEIKEYGFTAPGAILSKLAAQTNAYGFTHALHQFNLKRGCKVFDRTNIKKIDHNKQGVKLKTDDNIVINAKKLIYANGYEAVNYVDKKIVDLQSTYAVASENIPGEKWKDNVLIWNTDTPYLYMRTTNEGRILVGGKDEKFYNPQKRDKLIDKKSAALTKEFNKIFPQIEFIPEFTWTGTFGATKDGLPYIGIYKKLLNSYFALGFGGNGITFSAIAAEIIRDMILGKENTDAEIFSFDR